MREESFLEPGGTKISWESGTISSQTKKDLYLFQGSKYVQSTIGNAFFQVRDFLKSNRKVLFSGTPCQIQGLKKVIRKNSELLITVDIACHSVPSPKVWKSFFRNLIAKNRISDVPAFS